MQKSTCFFVCTGSFVQGSGAWGAGRRHRFVYAARGRTFRRPCRRNSAGQPPRRRAVRHAVRPRLPLPGSHESPRPSPRSAGIYMGPRRSELPYLCRKADAWVRRKAFVCRACCFGMWEHAFCPEYETRWERSLHRYEGGEAPLPRLPQHEAEASGRRAGSCFINV